jgi:hypothetical protein
VEVLAWLLPEAGSAVEDDTLALFVSVPAELGRTLSATVAVAPLPSVPRLQVTVALPVQLPWLALDDTKVAPAGRESETTTWDAELGPEFRAVSV